MFRRIYIAFILSAAILISACGTKPEKEKLPVTVKSNFNLLPEKPQFIMYLNFKNMKTSGFWKEFISDSVINAEKTLGSMLSLFRDATGASISEGLDEMYFANSWTGENAIVLKGIFDKGRLEAFTLNDSLFSKKTQADGITVYNHIPTGLFFFLKDSFTLCGSNYTKQIDQMKSVSDTTRAGLLLNDSLLNAVDGIPFKSSFWLISAEKTFIRGIFSNFALVKSERDGMPENMNIDSLMNRDVPDSVSKPDDILINRLHEKIISFSISGRMKDELKLLVQFECNDEESAEVTSKLFRGMISLAQLSSSLEGKKQASPVIQILNEMKIETYENSVMMEADITADNINRFRTNPLQERK